MTMRVATGAMVSYRSLTAMTSGILLIKAEDEHLSFSYFLEDSYVLFEDFHDESYDV